MIKRFFDLIASSLVGLFISPILLFISISILLTSKGGVLYRQNRVGKNGVIFQLLKFRTMYIGSDQKGLLTIGNNDNRITPIGYYLRKYKLDELPQLWNIIKGEMSIVGARPEVKKYVDLYTAEQKEVLQFCPGLTDYASIEYIDESTLLAKSKNPEQLYIKEIMPAKLTLNLKYIEEQDLLTDLKIILKTISKIIKK